MSSTGKTQPTHRKQQSPRHGVIRVSTLKPEHARQHLAAMVSSAAEVRDYGGHEVTGQNSQGAMRQGGASGADYQTSSADNVGDADSGGASDY
jgi:hypothetical protein